MKKNILYVSLVIMITGGMLIGLTGCTSKVTIETDGENDVQINSNFKSSFKYLLKENIISYNSFQGIKKFVNLTLERKISEDIIYDKYDKIKNFTLDHMNIEFNLVKHFQKSQKRKNIEKTKTEFIKFLGRKKPTLRKIRVETFKILTKRK